MANIEIKNIPGKGRGIITTKPIKEGEVIRISDCIPVTDRDCDPHSVIRSYWFIDKSGRGFLIALDWTSFMNHDDNANVDYRPINATQIKFVASRDINAGEELTINYGYDPSKHNKDIGIDMEQWNALTKTFDGGTGVGSAAAASTMGTDLGEANIKFMINKPEFRGVLTKIRRELEGAPRDTKSAFNVVLEYFAKPTGKGGKGKGTGTYYTVVRDTETGRLFIASEDEWNNKYYQQYPRYSGGDFCSRSEAEEELRQRKSRGKGKGM